MCCIRLQCRFYYPPLSWKTHTFVCGFEMTGLKGGARKKPLVGWWSEVRHVIFHHIQNSLEKVRVELYPPGIFARKDLKQRECFGYLPEASRKFCPTPGWALGFRKTWMRNHNLHWMKWGAMYDLTFTHHLGHPRRGRRGLEQTVYFELYNIISSGRRYYFVWK